MKYLTFITTSIAMLVIVTNSIASLNYGLINKKDTSYSNVKRGAIYISVTGSSVPNERELKDVSNDCWKKHKGSWKVGSVFIYVNDMETNGPAYSVAEYKNNKLSNFFVQKFALKISQMAKNKSKTSQSTATSYKKNDAGSLQTNSKYKISKKTPLMPDPNPKDKMKALEEVVYLQPSDIIQITGKEKVGNNLWYKVFAYKNSGSFVGFGWINSIALIGQDIEEI